MRWTCILLALVMVPSVATASPRGGRSGGNGPPRMPPAPVRVEEVVARKVREGRNFVGDVTPSRASVVGCGESGYLERLKAREGQRVSENDELASLRKDVITHQLTAARAALELRGHELRELENGPRPALLEQAKAALDEAEVDLELAKYKLTNAEELRERKRIAEELVREARDAVRAIEQRVRRLKAALALLEEGSREEQIAQARARKAQQAAEVQRLEAIEKRYTVRAPFDGYVTMEHVEAGQWVSDGDSIVTLVALDVVHVRVPVLEDYVVHLRKGDKVTLRLGPIRDRLFNGTIARIVPAADPRTRSFPVEIEVANERTEDGGVLLKAGMFARAMLPVGEEVDAVLVPQDALVLGGPSPTVFVVDEASQTARPVPVELGVVSKGQVAVTGALKQGDRVVTAGNERLRPGQPVEILP